MRIKVICPPSRQSVSSDRLESQTQVFRSYASPGTEVDVVYPDAGAHIGPRPGHISEARIESIVPFVIREAVKAEKDGFDGIWQPGEYNVGSEVARQIINIPLVDTGPAALHVASMVGDRICLIAIEDTVKPYVWKLLKRWGMSQFVTSLKSWNIPLSEVWNRQDEVKELTIKIAKEAIAKEDAQVILPYCAIFSPVIVPTEELEAEIGVPVINCPRVGLKMTELFVSLGIHKSEKAYPFAPADIFA